MQLSVGIGLVGCGTVGAAVAERLLAQQQGIEAHAGVRYDCEIAETVEAALERGAHVISANKDLIATQGPRLHAIAAACGGMLSYEAAVCAAIPIVRVLCNRWRVTRFSP